MLIPIPGKRNGIAYLLWSWLLKKYGAFSAWHDAYFFGPSHGINDYNSLPRYNNSHTKPDKQYSILPTVLSIAGKCGDKIIADLGCGTGFFTTAFAHQAKHIYGIDNSEAQLRLATKHKKVSYHLKDIFVDPLPQVDVYIAPFVVNYARTIPILRHFLQLLYEGLYQGGKVVFVVDLPNNKHLRRFGAVKRIDGVTMDGASMSIELFNDEKKICELSAFYFTAETIEKELKAAGFKEITWHKPIVSDEGKRKMGANFWEGYIEDSELGYLAAKK